MHDVWYISHTADWSRAVVVNAVQYDGRKTAEVPGCVEFLEALTYSVHGGLPHLAPYDLAPYAI